MVAALTLTVGEGVCESAAVGSRGSGTGLHSGRMPSALHAFHEIMTIETS